MQNFNDDSSLDALADAVAARLAGRTSFGPSGGPTPQLPVDWPQRPQLDDPLAGLRAGARVGIAGVEYTQSIQFNGDSGPSYGPDNAVPLVAYKTMVARVYPFVRRGLLGADTLTGQRVTGTLTLSIGDRVVYQTGPTRAAGARLGSSAQLERALWDSELTLFGGS
ncbi:MAG TPA: hypothetical protein VK689_22465, partial [Armatimonadota bacterium]|nr:hypothetical protein [Armatimonadota bacterium]